MTKLKREKERMEKLEKLMKERNAIEKKAEKLISQCRFEEAQKLLATLDDNAARKLMEQ